MRLLLLSLIAALSLTSLAAAQSNSTQDPTPVASSQPSSQLDTNSPDRQPADSARDVCYTMRSYIFERRGTEAPRLAGMVTCTPSTQRQFKRAKPAPKARLIPADSAEGK